MLQCRPLHWWRSNLTPPIDSCSPVKLPLGPERRTPHLSSASGPNLFQREVMKKLIISNEELAIEAGRNGRRHCSEESKRVEKSICQTEFIRDLRFSRLAASRGQPGFKQWSLPINLYSCHWKFCCELEGKYCFKVMHFGLPPPRDQNKAIRRIIKDLSLGQSRAEL